MSLFIVGLDSTIVNVALPSIGRELRASVSGLQWTIDAYTLVLASLLMFSGSTADRIGRRRTFQVGLAVFTAGSLLCSLAPGLGWLVVFRMVQAVGGSMLNPVAMSIITNTFTDRRERAQAIGVWGGVFGLSMALGPVRRRRAGQLGRLARHLLGQHPGRHRGHRALRAVRAGVEGGAGPPADPVGQVLLIVAAGRADVRDHRGPAPLAGASPLILGLFGLAAVALAVFVRYETRREDPLLNPRFFGSAPFAGATMTAVVVFAALGGFLFLNTLYLQDVRGFPALTAGLYLLPMAGAMAICSPLSGRIVAARGARIPLVTSGVALIAAGVLLTMLTDHSGPGFLFLSYVIFGIGIGLVNAPITNSAVSGMPRQQAGVAAGVASTSRQVGQSLGVAVIGSVLSGNLHGGMRAGFVAASRPGWWIVAACGAVTLILALVTTGPWALRTAKRTADLLSPADERSPVSVP